MMYFDLKINERLQIGDATIKILDKSGRLVRLAIDADRSQKVGKLSQAKKDEKST